MITQYIKQAIAQLRQQPVISGITIFGTAMAIFLIMLVVMMQQVKVAPFSPESNRDRFLHVKYMGLTNKYWGEGAINSGGMSVRTANECFQSLTTPEAVTTYQAFLEAAPVSLPGMPATSVDMRQTDDTFFRVFDFQFLSGKPYDKAQFDAGIPVVVLSESVARAVMGSTDVVGREVLIEHAPFKVVGVVRDVSTLASSAYAQIWLPYTSSYVGTANWCDGYMGAMSVTILAHSRDDFDAIRQETNRRGDAYNQLIGEDGFELLYCNRPYDQEKNALISSNQEPDVEHARRQRLIVYLILLLVPAINLSSMTQSRLRQRVAEIGVRRAFGSTRTKIINQVVMENMIVTLLAGVLGMALSILFAFSANSLLFSQVFTNSFNPPEVDVTMLLHPSTFCYALLFCFILNLLSSGIPAWRASRTPIVNALGGKTA